MHMYMCMHMHMCMYMLLLYVRERHLPLAAAASLGGGGSPAVCLGGLARRAAARLARRGGLARCGCRLPGPLALVAAAPRALSPAQPAHRASRAAQRRRGALRAPVTVHVCALCMHAVYCVGR